MVRFLKVTLAVFAVALACAIFAVPLAHLTRAVRSVFVDDPPSRRTLSLPRSNPQPQQPILQPLVESSAHPHSAAVAPPQELQDAYPFEVAGETFIVGPVDRVDVATTKRVEKVHIVYLTNPPHDWMNGK
jgi:hypothetical protein